MYSAGRLVVLGFLSSKVFVLSFHYQLAVFCFRPRRTIFHCLAFILSFVLVSFSLLSFIMQAGPVSEGSFSASRIIDSVDLYLLLLFLSDVATGFKIV